MGTKVEFNGKTIKQPGVYSVIKSGMKNPPISLSYGNVLLIDTGSSANWGTGAGIEGTITKNIASIQEFQRMDDFQDMIRGGLWWKACQWLWKPKNNTIRGISKLFFIKAAATVPAEILYEWGDYGVSGSGSGLKGGDVTVQVRNEGLVGNGVEVASVLTRGYACRMAAGPNAASPTPDKFILKFYAGTWKGLDPAGVPWDDITEADTEPELLVTSDEFETIQQLVDWMNDNATFNVYFKLKDYSIVGTGVVDNADLIANAGNKLATGGTETYSSAYLDQVLNNVTDLDYTFIICDKWGDNARGSENGKILAHIETEARYDKFMVVGGGKDENKFKGTTNASTVIADYYNSNRVIVVHAGFKKAKQSGAGYKEFDSIFKAAAVLGRTCGLEPQVPITFKSIDMDADLHDMNSLQQDYALDHGVVFTRFDVEIGDFVINQGVNSLQSNDYLVNNDGKSYEIAIERIKAQLNKEIIYNAKRDLFANESGTNRSTLSTAVVQQWLTQFLSKKIATETTDNLIISFENITVTLVGDYYKVDYEFTPNFPVNKLFITGLIIDPTL